MQQAANKLMKMGCKAVLIKGGHLLDEAMIDILFVEGETPLKISEEVVSTNNTHGTGCTLSSAIASHLALELSLKEAVKQSKKYISEALKAGADVRVGAGHGPVNHAFAPIPLRKLPIR